MPALHPQIIVIEPVETTRLTMLAALGALGHSVQGISPAEALGAPLLATPVDIVVLCLGGDEGLHLARHVRVALPDTGVIMLSARTRQDDKVDGYDSGADIFLTRPTSTEELSAAIHALARRVCPSVSRPVMGLALTLSPSTLQLKGQSAAVDVSDIECCLLSALAAAPEQRLLTRRLMEIAGRNSIEPTKGALEVQIVRLRKKLELAGARPPCIKVIRGTGYQLCVPISVSNRLPAIHHA
jgi:DNA-binding response OmpR family regulator